MAGAPRSNDTRGKFDLGRSSAETRRRPTRGKVGFYPYIFVAVGPAQSVGTAQPVGDNGSAGGFAGIWNGMDILFFCDDLDHHFSLSSTYTDDYQASSLSLLPGTFGNKLSRLFTEA